MSRCQKNKCEKHFCVCRFRKLKSTRKSPPPEVGAKDLYRPVDSIAQRPGLFLFPEHRMQVHFPPGGGLARTNSRIWMYYRQFGTLPDFAVSLRVGDHSTRNTLCSGISGFSQSEISNATLVLDRHRDVFGSYDLPLPESSKPCVGPDKTASVTAFACPDFASLNNCGVSEESDMGVFEMVG